STLSPSSSSSSLARVCAAFSPASGFPPGCMNFVVPCLRTTSTRPCASWMIAALTWMSGTGEDLSGIEQVERIEHGLDLTLQLPLVVTELLREPAALEHADAVLTRERAAEADRRSEQV